MKKSTNTIILLIFTAILFSCSSSQNYNTAIRIKPGKENKYSINPNTGIPRNGNTLRGHIVSVDYVTEPDTCPEFNKLVTNKYVVFIDSSNKRDQFEERIEIEDIELISNILDIKPNDPNIDIEELDTLYFETYNDPLLPKEVIAFPVKKVLRDCSAPCPCDEFARQRSSLTPALEPGKSATPFSFKCKERDLKWWFLSANYTQNFFEDYVENRKYKFLSNYGVDLTAGLRLGESHRWNIGIMYSLLPNIYNQIDSAFYHSYVANLYFKYDLIRNRKYNTVRKSDISSLDQIVKFDTVKTMSYDGFRDSIIIVQKVYTNELLNMSSRSPSDYIEVRPCPNPYIFGGFGMAFDELSRDLIRLRTGNMICDAPVVEMIKSTGKVDIALPVNFHLGLGLEIPISTYVDLTMDVSYRSLAFGERVYFRNYITPARKQIDSFVFRIGLNF